MFNWPQFLQRQGIHYVTRGPNTGRGRLSVRCPFCGEADPSEHMGIALRGTHWGCLRNSNHRGNSRPRLIQALLRCSWEMATRLAGEPENAPTPLDEDFSGEISKLLGLVPLVKFKPTQLEFLTEFKTLKPTGLGTPFWSYLEDRGYDSNQIQWLVTNYNLLYATRGDFRYRLIIPIYDAKDKLQSWTGRSIIKSESIRYKTLSLVEKPGYTNSQVALQPSSNLLLGLPLLWRVRNATTLVVCEGPFDAFRISVLGHEKGTYGTGFFGLNVSDAQLDLLEDLARKFDFLVLLIDPDAKLAQFRLLDKLSRLNVRVGNLPKGVKDPAELSAQQLSKMMEEWDDYQLSRRRT